ncbi:MAG TPA: MBL fold metallo-hydrolase, partial [Gemmatimonadaceae bacterium]|nr:MBL fold metallo-hydrolase [Gemmatimonadaceae bacterium]
MRHKLKVIGVACIATCAVAFAKPPARPDHVDITWMSVTNMYYELGDLRIVTDGYITRLPEKLFIGSGLDSTREPATSDTAAVKRVLNALGGPRAVNLLLTGHNHFDHALDTPTWAKLSGARIIGSKTTCFQAMALGIPAEKCTPVYGGEKFPLADGVTMYVVRWNHSGDPVKSPRLHNPQELAAPPKPDPRTGGLRLGVAEDFPNGGGNRAYLFVVDGAGGRFSWFFHNSAAAVDLGV